MVASLALLPFSTWPLSLLSVHMHVLLGKDFHLSGPLTRLIGAEEEAFAREMNEHFLCSIPLYNDHNSPLDPNYLQLNGVLTALT